MFQVSLTKLDSVGKAVDFELGAEWGHHALRGTEVKWNAENRPGAFHGWVQRTGQQILLRGRLKASLLCECARCLEDAAVNVDADLTLMFYPRPIAPARPAKSGTKSGKKSSRDDEVELSEEELVEAFYSGDTLELDETFREHLLLEVPMQPLCRPDCAGISAS